jgi:hypothetical protein
MTKDQWLVSWIRVIRGDWHNIRKQNDRRRRLIEGEGRVVLRSSFFLCASLLLVYLPFVLLPSLGNVFFVLLMREVGIRMGVKRCENLEKLKIETKSWTSRSLPS